MASSLWREKEDVRQPDYQSRWQEGARRFIRTDFDLSARLSDAPMSQLQAAAGRIRTWSRFAITRFPTPVFRGIENKNIQAC